MKKFGSYRELYLLERNALLSMYKNLSDDLLSAASAPPGACAVPHRRSLPAAGPWFRPHDRGAQLSLTGAYALDYLVEQLPTLVESRRHIQATRVRGDADLLPLFREPIEPAYPLPEYLACHEALVEIFGLAEAFERRPRVLVVTGDPLSKRMAGPGIRAWQMAAALATTHAVRLGSTTAVDLTDSRFDIVDLSDSATLDFHLHWADVIVFQGFLLAAAPWLIDSDKIIVADIYDPMHLGAAGAGQGPGSGAPAGADRRGVRGLNVQIRRATACCVRPRNSAVLDRTAHQPGSRQRGDPADAEGLLRVVPFGVDDTSPAPSRHGIRGAIEGIGMTDKVILWGGGVCNWFDPLTLIHAVAMLAERHDDVRLVFMGMKHPNLGAEDGSRGMRSNCPRPSGSPDGTSSSTATGCPIASATPS
jgi:hypothetical protein